MAPLVEQLRRARERAGLSLEDISRRTKIQISLLKAIEHGDFEHVPGGLFVRGFLRAYAKHVGLDPESVVSDYLDQYEPERLARAEHHERPDIEVREDVILAQSDAEGFSVRKLWPVAAIAVVVVGILIIVGSGSRNEPAAEAQAVGTSGRAAPVPEPSPRPVEPLSLDIRAKRDVWVAATADSQRVVYRTLKAGERVTVTGRSEISARIGDADALEYSVNGVTAQPLGQSGEVRDILITPGSFRTFKVERSAPQTPQVPRR